MVLEVIVLKITFLGHACFLLEGSKKVLFDPFISGNPLAKTDWRQVEADYILLTHGHGDHLGDAAAIASKTGGALVAQPELLRSVNAPGATKLEINTGGNIYPCPGLRIKMTAAWHSASIKGPDGFYGGMAGGYLVWMDGLCFYHAGDTGLFADMREIIGREKIDIAFLPIGDVYTMGPEDAIIAAGWLRAGTVIPMHYNTFSSICQDAAAFKTAVEARTDSKCTVLEPGGFINL